MRHLRPVFITITVLTCLACAAAPAPPKAPEDIHQGIRDLNKGAVEYQKGCYDKALQYVRSAHERFSLVDNLSGSAASLNTLANIYYRLGDLRGAMLVYDEAAALFEQLDQRPGLVRVLTNKSAVLIASGKLDQASRTLDHVDEMAKNTRILKSLRLKTRALLHMARGDSRSAEALLIEALNAASQSESGLLADIHYTLAQIKVTIPQLQEALSHLQTALELDRRAGAYFSTGLDLEALGSCHENLADYTEAFNYYKRSLKIFAMLEAHHKVQFVRTRLVSCAENAGLNAEAVLHWSEQWSAGRNEAGLCD
jgi:tetratricopeptide (TPR) repeat protein